MRTDVKLFMLGLTVLGASGCGGSPGPAKGTVALTPKDFAAPQDRPAPGLILAADDAADGSDAEPPSPAPLPPAPSPGPREAVIQVQAPTPPVFEGEVPAPLGGSVLVDAKIGDINGKPVYASKFLEPRANKLRERAAELRRSRNPAWRAQWRQEALRDFVVGLNSMIEDELLRAEAIANFTPEQRMGFFAWMQSVSDRLASENRGSVSAASRNIALTRNQTMQEYLREREVQELVMFQINKHVRSRVNVSWRDIKQWYDTHYEELFNRPPIARFRLVQISNRNRAGLEEFTRELGAGTPFTELATRSFNANNAAEGGLEEKKLTGERSSMTFYNHPELNRAAQTLEVGQYAGPIALGDFTAWIYLEDILDQRRDLYDVQLVIENELRAAKMRTEHQKYIARLRSKATVTSVEEMARRLLEIAEERYLPRED
jgi:parvulin-like peptidyl-prolyl isomerase